MDKWISAKKNGNFVYITILAAIFIIIYSNCVFADDKRFKSEEYLLDETRANIEKHLNDRQEAKASVVAKEKVKSNAQEEPIVVKEEQEKTTQVEPAVEEKSSVQEEYAVENNSAVVNEEALSEEELPVVREEEPLAAEEEPAVAETEGIPSDVMHVTLTNNKTDNSLNQQTAAEEIDVSPKSEQPAINPAIEAPILKKMDISKIGASPYYETYEGLRLLKYFTVAQRVEIYEEPRPIDSYILDAFAMRIIYPNTPWNIESDYRTQITPIFTRAYGTEITMSDPRDKEGQIRYTHDYREIYKNYWPKYQYQNSTLKKEMWDQNEILLMHTKEIDPIGWFYTSNVGYRYSTMSAKSDQSYYENRHTYFGSLSLAPNPLLEYFFQGEYYKSMHLKSSYDYRPDHFLGRTELRIKSNDMKTSFVPQFSFSKDTYYPFWNTFEKYEIALRVGRDFTKRFSATSTAQYVYSFRDEPDNQGPNLYGNTQSLKNPHKDKAEYISLENRFSYNVYDRLYLQAGIDIANGLNWSIFDNWGLLAGLEYYAPGIIRVDVGWRGNHYYNLDDYLSSVYFKFYLFM